MAKGTPRADPKAAPPATAIELDKSEASSSTGTPSQVSSLSAPPSQASSSTTPPSQASSLTSPPSQASSSTPPPPQASSSTPPPPQASSSTAPPPQASSSTAPPSQASSSTAPPSQASSSTAPPSQASSSTAPPSQASSSTAPPSQASSLTAPPSRASSSTAPPLSDLSYRSERATASCKSRRDESFSMNQPIQANFPEASISRVGFSADPMTLMRNAVRDISIAPPRDPRRLHDVSASSQEGETSTQRPHDISASSQEEETNARGGHDWSASSQGEEPFSPQSTLSPGENTEGFNYLSNPSPSQQEVEERSPSPPEQAPETPVVAPAAGPLFFLNSIFNTIRNLRRCTRSNSPISMGSNIDYETLEEDDLAAERRIKYAPMIMTFAIDHVELNFNHHRPYLVNGGLDARTVMKGLAVNLGRDPAEYSIYEYWEEFETGRHIEDHEELLKLKNENVRSRQHFMYIFQKKDWKYVCLEQTRRYFCTPISARQEAMEINLRKKEEDPDFIQIADPWFTETWLDMHQLQRGPQNRPRGPSQRRSISPEAGPSTSMARDPARPGPSEEIGLSVLGASSAEDTITRTYTFPSEGSGDTSGSEVEDPDIVNPIFCGTVHVKDGTKHLTVAQAKNLPNKKEKASWSVRYLLLRDRNLFFVPTHAKMIKYYERSDKEFREKMKKDRLKKPKDRVLQLIGPAADFHVYTGPRARQFHGAPYGGAIYLRNVHGVGQNALKMMFCPKPKVNVNVPPQQGEEFLFRLPQNDDLTVDQFQRGRDMWMCAINLAKSGWKIKAGYLMNAFDECNSIQIKKARKGLREKNIFLPMDFGNGTGQLISDAEVRSMHLTADIPEPVIGFDHYVMCPTGVLSHGPHLTQMYYHKELGRQRAEMLLDQESRGDGSFLLRNSETRKDCLVISYVSGNRFYHKHIYATTYQEPDDMDGSKKIYVATLDSMRAFYDVHSLIEFHRINKVPALVCTLNYEIKNQQQKDSTAERIMVGDTQLQEAILKDRPERELVDYLRREGDSWAAVPKKQKASKSLLKKMFSAKSKVSTPSRGSEEPRTRREDIWVTVDFSSGRGQVVSDTEDIDAELEGELGLRYEPAPRGILNHGKHLRRKYFHGNIDDRTAKYFLRMENLGTGTFLLRNSQSRKDCLTLCLFTGKYFFSKFIYPIKYQNRKDVEASTNYLCTMDFRTAFYEVHELIKYYRYYRLPNLECTLNYEVEDPRQPVETNKKQIGIAKEPPNNLVYLKRKGNEWFPCVSEKSWFTHTLDKLRKSSSYESEESRESSTTQQPESTRTRESLASRLSSLMKDTSSSRSGSKEQESKESQESSSSRSGSKKQESKESSSSRSGSKEQESKESQESSSSRSGSKKQESKESSSSRSGSKEQESKESQESSSSRSGSKKQESKESLSSRSGSKEQESKDSQESSSSRSGSKKQESKEKESSSSRSGSKEQESRESQGSSSSTGAIKKVQRK